MSGILDFLRGAIAPTAAARVGYLGGQERERDKARAEAMQDRALSRQTTLDEIKAAVDASTISRNGAQADRYRRMPAGARDSYERFTAADGTVYERNRYNPDDIRIAKDPDSGEAIQGNTQRPGQPHEIIDSDGYYRRWDPDKAEYVNTGIKAGSRPSTRRTGSGARSASQDRLDAQAALSAATKMTPRPSTIPQRIVNPAITGAKKGIDIRKLDPMIDNPKHYKAVDDSLAFEANTLGPLRQHLMDVTVGDQVDIGGVSPPGKSPNAPPVLSPRAPVAPKTGDIDLRAKPQISSEQMHAAETEYAEAARKLTAVLNSPLLPDDLKKKAKAAYDARVLAITKKYGMRQ